MLGYVDSFGQFMRDGVKLERIHFQELLAFLNKKGSVLILDTLERSDIKELCAAQLKRMLKTDAKASRGAHYIAAASSLGT